MAINARTIGLACLVLNACTLGPDFVAPISPTPDSWLRRDASDATNVAVAEPIDAQWWQQLNDPLLNDLVGQLADANLDVQTATARINQSRAQRGAAAADFYPQLTGDASYMREKQSDKGAISLFSGGASAGAAGGGAGAGGAGVPATSKTPPFNLYQYGFDASWEIDLWGRVRRTVEAADAQVLASEETRRDVTLSAIAELVSDYVQLRGTQASLALTQEALKTAREFAFLTQERAKGGLGNELDTANAAAQVATTEASLAPLQQQQQTLMNAIALLLAKEPGAMEPVLAAAKPIPPAPIRVPVGIPSELVRRRPDIRQAEAALHAATASIGAAKADFFPKLTLLGNGSLQSTEFNSLNSWAARSYSYGPSFSVPIFEGGRLSSTLALRNAEQEEAALAYRKTVLGAFHEVDNALTAFQTEQQRQRALQTAVEQNRQALALANDLYKQGLNTFLDVLTAQRGLFDAMLQSANSNQTVSVDMVQLYKALGGGWESAFPETDQQNAAKK